MSAIVRRWLHLHCNVCDRRRIFVVRAGWLLECSRCGHERRLAANGLVEKRELTAAGSA